MDIYIYISKSIYPYIVYIYIYIYISFNSVNRLKKNNLNTRRVPNAWLINIYK